MKKFSCLLMLFVLLVKANGQIAQDTAYASALVHLNAGYKLMENNIQSFTLKNMDYTIYKTISVPQTYILINPGIFSPNANLRSIRFISDNLFDSDSDIEYLATYKSNSGGFETTTDTVILALVDETDGVIQILQGFSICVGGPYCSVNNNYDFTLKYIGDGSTFSKLIVNSDRPYSLPGYLPCEQCGTVLFKSEISESQFSGKLFPNPSISQINIELPVSAKSSFFLLKMYDLKGTVVYQQKFGGNQKIINPNTDKLPTGTYFVEIANDSNDIVYSEKLVLSQ